MAKKLKRTKVGEYWVNLPAPIHTGKKFIGYQMPYGLLLIKRKRKKGKK